MKLQTITEQADLAGVEAIFKDYMKTLDALEAKHKAFFALNIDRNINRHSPDVVFEIIKRDVAQQLLDMSQRALGFPLTFSPREWRKFVHHIDTQYNIKDLLG